MHWLALAAAMLAIAYHEVGSVSVWALALSVVRSSSGPSDRSALLRGDPVADLRPLDRRYGRTADADRDRTAIAVCTRRGSVSGMARTYSSWLKGTKGKSPAIGADRACRSFLRSLSLLGDD